MGVRELDFMVADFIGSVHLHGNIALLLFWRVCEKIHCSTKTLLIVSIMQQI